MAGATIDNINIVATADVSSAIKSLDKLQEKLSGLKGAATKAAPAVKSTEKSVDDAGKTSEKTTKSVSKLAAALKRVLVYRALRAAIKNIAQAFNEGTKNAYAWADANNDAFKQVMDTYATRTAYLKNSLGAVASTVLTALLPAFMTITDLLIKGINYVNEFIAAIKGALTGDYSYLKAKEVAVEFAESTDDAAKAQKKLNQQLMAFDELNVITTPRDTARGSGDAGKWDDAFERTEVSQWMKDNWGWIAGAAGVAILAPMLTNWVTGALSTAVGSAVSGLPGMFNTALIALGAIEIVLGLKAIFDGIKDIAGGNTEEGMWEMLKGIIKTAFGTGLISMLAFGSSLGAYSVAITLPLLMVFAISEWLISNFPSKKEIEDKLNEKKVKADATGKPVVSGQMTAGAPNQNGYTVTYPNGYRTPEQEAALTALVGAAGVGNQTISAASSSGATGLGAYISHGIKNITKLAKEAGMYASGGFPSMGSVFVAGEVPGAAEFVGNINGRTGVASGEEITGISEAVYSTGGETNALLRELIAVSSSGNGRPNAAFGKFVTQSLNLYKGVTG